MQEENCSLTIHPKFTVTSRVVFGLKSDLDDKKLCGKIKWDVKFKFQSVLFYIIYCQKYNSIDKIFSNLKPCLWSVNEYNRYFLFTFNTKRDKYRKCALVLYNNCILFSFYFLQLAVKAQKKVYFKYTVLCKQFLNEFTNDSDSKIF